MSLRTELKQAWDALAYADVGEFLPYADKCRILGVEPPPHSQGYLPPPDEAPHRSIAFNLGRDLDPQTLNYAIDLAQCLKAGLILLRSPTGAPQALKTDLEDRIDAAGVGREEVTLTAPWADSVASFLRRRADVLCLILGAGDLDWRSLISPLPRGGRRAFPTPVVVVGGTTHLPRLA